MKTQGRILAMCFAGLIAPPGSAQDLDPSRVASWPGYLRGKAGVVAVSGDEAFVGAGSLLVVDVSDPRHPSIARIYPGLTYVGDLVVSNRRACVWDGHMGLHLLDLENPAQDPIPVPGYGPHQLRPEAMALAGDLLLATIFRGPR